MTPADGSVLDDRHQPVFLTGGTGFIGYHLAAELLRRGHPVRALVRSGSDPSRLTALGVDVVIGDLWDPSAVGRALAGCGVVYHLAAYRAGRLSRRADFEKVNVHGTRCLLRAAEAAGVKRFIFVSSTAVYGQLRRPPATEELPPAPTRYHAITKRQAELLLEEFAIERRLSTVIARLPVVLGPNQKHHVRVFREVVTRRRFVVLGSGDTSYNIADIDDVVDGLLRCAAASAGGCYLIGGWNTTINEHLRIIADEAGVDCRIISLPLLPAVAVGAFLRWLFHLAGYEPAIVKAVDFFAHEKMLDGTKARDELGYTPKVALRDCIRRKLNWLRETGQL